MNFPSVFTISASSTQATCTFVSEYASFFHPASDGATWLTDFSMVTFAVPIASSITAPRMSIGTGRP